MMELPSRQSPLRRLALASVALGVALAAAACGDDPLAPRDVAGTYAFIGRWPVNPLADPAPRIDTITFDAVGHGSQVIHAMVWTQGSPAPQPARHETTFVYELKGRTILVTFTDIVSVLPQHVAAAVDVPGAPRGTSMVPGPHLRGTLTSRGLLLTSAYSPGDTLYYERVPGSLR